MPTRIARTRRRARDVRRRVRLGPVLGLTAVWLLLWGRVSPNLVLLGLVVATAIVQTFPLPEVGRDGRVRPLAVLRLLGSFVRDLVVASVEVAWLAIRRGPSTPAAVVAVTLRSRSELLMAMTAEVLSLVPGTLVVELRRATGTMFLHVLGPELDDPAAATRRQVLALEAQVIRAFGSDAELAALEAEGHVPA